MGRLGWNFLGESCLRENIWYFSPKKKTSIIHLFLRPASCASSFLCFFKTSLWKHRKTTKKRCNKIHQVQNCQLSGCQSYASSSWKKNLRSEAPRNSIHWKQGCGCTCLGSWDWTNGSQFVRVIFWVFCTFGKKVSPKFVHIVSLSCQAQLFCHWHIQQGYDWVSADYTNPDAQCMIQKQLITRNIATLLHGKWLGSFTHMKLVVSWGPWWWCFVDTWYLKRNPPITPGMQQTQWCKVR